MENNEEMSVEERAELWLQSEYGATINESPSTAHAYIAGWKEATQQSQSDIIKLIEGEIAQVNLEIEHHGKNYINGVRLETLTALLTKIKS